MQNLFTAVAVSGTNVYRSTVMKLAKHEGFLAIFSHLAGSTNDGALAFQVQELDDKPYKDAVDAAGSEAANTTGWRTIPLSAQTGSTVDAAGAIVVTNGDHHTVLIPALGNVRVRWQYTNATDSGTLNGVAFRNTQA